MLKWGISTPLFARESGISEILFLKFQTKKGQRIARRVGERGSGGDWSVYNKYECVSFKRLCFLKNDVLQKMRRR